MAIKLKLEMTVKEGGNYLLSRVPIRYIERGETRHDVDSPSSPNGASIDELHKSLYRDGAKVKVKIEWIPTQGTASALNKTKKNIEITISWLLRDTDTNQNVVIKSGTFSGVNITNAIGSTIQVVEFTSTNFVPDLGLVHESRHVRA